MDEKFVINIGRQLGSGGREIGKKLAAELNITFFDKELINLASQESGLKKEFFEKADEKASRGISGLLGLRFPFINDGAISSNNYLSNDSLFKIQSDVIRNLSEKESCLFVGRCADYILRDNSRCVNIFISAPLEDRIKRICKTTKITPEKAEEIIVKTDRERASYYNYYSYKVWGAASTYHLCIDSSILGTDETVSFIKLFIKKRFEL